MYFEEIKRRPSKMGKQRQLKQSERPERDERKTTRGHINREGKIPAMRKRKG
jgi:hypothetical protein